MPGYTRPTSTSPAPTESKVNAAPTDANNPTTRASTPTWTTTAQQNAAGWWSPTPQNPRPWEDMAVWAERTGARTPADVEAFFAAGDPGRHPYENVMRSWRGLPQGNQGSGGGQGPPSGTNPGGNVPGPGAERPRAGYEDMTAYTGPTRYGGEPNQMLASPWVPPGFRAADPLPAQWAGSWTPAAAAADNQITALLNNPGMNQLMAPQTIGGRR